MDKYLFIALAALVVISLPEITPAQTSEKSKATETAGETGTAKIQQKKAPKKTESMSRIELLEKEIKALKEELLKSDSPSTSINSLQEGGKSIRNFLKENLPDEKQLKEIMDKGQNFAADFEKKFQEFLESDEFKEESKQLNKLTEKIRSWSLRQKEALTKKAEDKATDLSISSVRQLVDKSIESEMPRLQKMLELAKEEAKKAGVDFDQDEMKKVQKLVEVSIAGSLNSLESFASNNLRNYPKAAKRSAKDQGLSAKELESLRKQELTYAANIYNLEELKKKSTPEVAKQLDQAIATLKQSHLRTKLQLQQSRKSKASPKKKLSFYERMKLKAAAAKKKLVEKLNEPVDEFPETGDQKAKKPTRDDSVLDEEKIMKNLKKELSSLKKELQKLNDENKKKEDK